ncbi:nucleoside diphosphate kinase regulator [Enterobacter hormaechei]
MSRPTIIINELDAERIDRLLEKPEFASLPVADALNEELDRAQMCTPETMPHDVVTMNSQVKFRNLTTGEELSPYAGLSGADDRQQHATVGAGTRGRGAAWTAHGDTIHWELPGGASAHLEVLELFYQPEAAGDYLR